MSLWGIFECPKWLYLDNQLIMESSVLAFIKPKIKADERIGPHNKEVLSVIIGSMLGDSNGEKHGQGTRFILQQEESNMEYLFWFYRFFAERGYCSNIKPKISIRLGKNGKIRYYYRIRTFTFTSFNWIHELFYVNNVKQIPKSIVDYLTPLALAIWIMKNGGAISVGLKISINSYTLEEVEFLCKVLYDKYNLKVTSQSTGVDNQYIIYIPKKSMTILSELVKPYMLPSIHYKLKNY